MNLLDKQEVAKKLHMSLATFQRHLRTDWAEIFPKPFPLTNTSNAQKLWIEPEIEDWILVKRQNYFRFHKD